MVSQTGLSTHSFLCHIENVQSVHVNSTTASVMIRYEGAYTYFAIAGRSAVADTDLTAAQRDPPPFEKSAGAPSQQQDGGGSRMVCTRNGCGTRCPPVTCRIDLIALTTSSSAAWRSTSQG